MKNIVISGTSGVGKTYLEEYLESRDICWQLPKYFDRKNRPGERKDKNVSMSKKEWKEVQHDFFFTLSYNGNNYGWKKPDIKNGKVATISITLDSLDSFLKANSDYIPILLWVDQDGLNLLRKRMDARREVPEVIEQRLVLARNETKQIGRYKSIVHDYGGWVVQIEDDTTIYKELVPKILTRYNDHYETK